MTNINNYNTGVLIAQPSAQVNYDQQAAAVQLFHNQSIPHQQSQPGLPQASDGFTGDNFPPLSTSTVNQWHTANNNRTKRFIPDDQVRDVRQRTVTDQVNVSNRFQTLSDLNMEDPNDNEKTDKKVPKPAPIILPGIDNIGGLITFLIILLKMVII